MNAPFLVTWKGDQFQHCSARARKHQLSSPERTTQKLVGTLQTKATSRFSGPFNSHNQAVHGTVGNTSTHRVGRRLPCLAEREAICLGPRGARERTHSPSHRSATASLPLHGVGNNDNDSADGCIALQPRMHTSTIGSGSPARARKHQLSSPERTTQKLVGTLQTKATSRFSDHLTRTSRPSMARSGTLGRSLADRRKGTHAPTRAPAALPCWARGHMFRGGPRTLVWRGNARSPPAIVRWRWQWLGRRVHSLAAQDAHTLPRCPRGHRYTHTLLQPSLGDRVPSAAWSRGTMTMTLQPRKHTPAIGSGSPSSTNPSSETRLQQRLLFGHWKRKRQLGSRRSRLEPVQTLLHPDSRTI